MPPGSTPRPSVVLLPRRPIPSVDSSSCPAIPSTPAPPPQSPDVPPSGSPAPAWPAELIEDRQGLRRIQSTVGDEVFQLIIPLQLPHMGFHRRPKTALIAAIAT